MKGILKINKFVTILFLLGFSHIISAQNLSLKQLLVYPYYSSDQLADTLKAGGWDIQSADFNKDSNFVKKTWIKTRKKENLKYYLIFYEFQKDTSENYIVYQFSEWPVFDSYKNGLKEAGYKIMSQKSKKKGKKESAAIEDEREEIFAIKKQGKLTRIKEYYKLGLNSFLMFSYKANSAMVKFMLAKY